jgi:hypothetical protein
MADRYWVGGSGNWDATSTANWSDSSGGASGASAPTSVDNVIFDANSNVGVGTFNVTITGTVSAPAACNDFSTGGAGGALDGAMTLTMGATAQLDCYDSMTLPATNFTISATSLSILRFAATTTGKTLTSNGVNFSSLIIVFDGVGGEWTLGSAYTSAQAIRVLAGSFNTGNYNASFSQLSTQSTVVRSISLGSSTVTLSATTATSVNPTNLTLNAGTSTIICTAPSPSFDGDSFTYYNVSFTSAAAGTVTILGANTFNNLTFTSRSATGNRLVSIGENQTINGTLTFGAANTAIRRVTVISSAVGTPRTLTLNGTLAALADVDFRDIVAAGTVATPWTGTRLADCLGNSNITFDAPKTVYRVGTGNWSATQWSLLSGGAVDVNNFPLAQDTMVFDTGTTTGTHTIDAGWQLGTLDCSLIAVAATIATGTQTPTFYGNFVLDADITLTGTGAITFAGQSATRQITSAGVSFTQSLTLNAPLGTVQLQANLTTTSATATNLTAGTLNLSNNTLTCVLFSSSNSNTRAIAFGTGNITVTGNSATVWSMATATNFTYTGTPTVNFSYAGATGTRAIQHGTTTGGTELNAININITAGTDTAANSGVCKNLDFTGFSGTVGSAARTIYGNLIIPGTVSAVTATTNTWTFGATSGTQEITTNNNTLDFPLTFNGIGGTFAFQDALTQGSTRAFTITNGTVQLKNGVTTTVGSFTTSGTTQKFLQSTTPGSQATLSQASGTVNASYLTIQDINAIGGATWLAYVDQSNIDAGDNDGWDFGISPVVGGAEYTYTIRSFTQPRRF